MTNTRAASPAARAYHIVTAVWGTEYTRLFLDVCVPNQLSPGNLPAMPASTRYRIFTSGADVEVLTRSAALDEVRRLMPVDIVEVDLAHADPGGSPNRYKLMTACHRRAVADAAAAGAAIMFMAPDFVLGDGTMAALVRRHRDGARAVLTMNLRLSRESFRAAWRAHEQQRALAPRDLVRLGLQHLHPAIESLMIDASTTNDFPTAICWPMRAGTALDGVLVRTLHLHPLLVDPVLRHELPESTTDGHYVMQCCPDPAECVVVTDSDELIAFELTPAARAIGNSDRRRGVSMLRLAAVIAKCDDYQRSHIHRTIRIHAGDLDSRWAAVDADAGRFIEGLRRYRPYGPALRTMYRFLKASGRQRRGSLRAIRRSMREYGRLIDRTARMVRRQQHSARQVVRPFKLVMHRAGKAWKLRVKRIRRFHLSPRHRKHA